MKIIRYFLKGLAIAIAALVIAAAASFAVSNRTPVAISLWPLPFESTLPLGTTVLAALAIGLVVGTALMSLSRLRLYFRARRNERRAETAERTAARHAEQVQRQQAPSGTALPSPSSRIALSDN